MILFSTLGGIAAFGPMGFIIGPILAAVFVTSWEIFGTAFEDVIPVAQPIVLTDGKARRRRRPRRSSSRRQNTCPKRSRVARPLAAVGEIEAEEDAAVAPKQSPSRARSRASAERRASAPPGRRRRRSRRRGGQDLEAVTGLHRQQVPIAEAEVADPRSVWPPPSVRIR